MIRLLIIADDFTGALDTGVQFAKRGIATNVTTNMDIDYSPAKETQVLVFDAETRHLPPEEAYRRVYNAARRGIELGAVYLYKKTDSGLRGNIGAELEAILDASEQKVLHFAPAFPAMNRITRGGIHYIDGVPLTESMFGRDPFEPVKHSFIPELIAAQSGVSVDLVEAGKPAQSCNGSRICLYDAWEREHLQSVITSLSVNERTVLAGCAGFAECLADIIESDGMAAPSVQAKRGLMILSGSVSPVTLAQLNFAQLKGFSGLSLTAAQKLGDLREELPVLLSEINSLCAGSNRVSIRTAMCADDVKATDMWAVEHNISAEVRRERIAANLGIIGYELLRGHKDFIFTFVGGDTLLSAMEELGVSDMVPVAELLPGVVLSEICYMGESIYVATKSGGFGGEDLFVRLGDVLESKGYLQA